MKSKGFSHFILTRYNTAFDVNLKRLYDKPNADKWMDEREPLFEKTKESVLFQKGDFKWIISIDYRTPEKYLKKIFTDDRMIMIHCDIRDAFKEVEVGGWVISSRLDNDDCYLPGAVKAIQSAFSEKESIIDIPYYIYDGKDRWTSERYTPNSPFLSLVNKDKRNCFARPHNKMSRSFGKSIFACREPKALMVVHENNQKNHILPNSKKVK